MKDEIGQGAIFGPFKDPPFDDFHTSPFMTRPKPGAPHRRVIIDLSFPHGQAVNSKISKNQYLGTEFVLTLPSIDIITNKVKQFGKGSLLYKTDISRAFRHVKIDPRDYFFVRFKALELKSGHLPALQIQEQIGNFSAPQQCHTLYNEVTRL